MLNPDKKIKIETLDISTQPQTLSEVLASPKSAMSEQIPTSVMTTTSITSMSITTVATSTTTTSLDIKPDIKTEIKTEVKQEMVDSTSAVVKEENMDTTSAVSTPKVEPSSDMDEPKPSPMDAQSGSNTPAASPAPPKPRQKKGRLPVSSLQMHCFLTHIYSVDFSIPISWMSPCPNLGVSAVLF